MEILAKIKCKFCIFWLFKIIYIIYKTMFYKISNLICKNNKLNKTLAISIIGGYLSYKLYKYINRNDILEEEENSVESELRDFLSQSNEICKKCDSLNRNILNKDDLKCWNCDSILNEKDHPTTTVSQPST